MRRFADLRYKLTNKVTIYGCGCKLEKLELENLLHATGLDVSHDPRVLAGVGDDAGVVKISANHAVVQHIDFFTPIIDDPYIQGQIAACNVSSDIFAKGVTNLLGALTMLGLPEDMPADVLQGLVRGFSHACKSIGVPIVGGQTIYCAWPIIGGAITGLGEVCNIIYNSKARPGDELVLTKPLGVRSVMAVLRESPKSQMERTKGVDKEIVSQAIDQAIRWTTTHNKAAAEVMVEVGVSACTDVTGFGILGHASNLARRSKVSIVIDTLPVIRGATKLAESFRHDLVKGTSAETSGGLLMSVQRSKLDLLSSALESKGVPAYHIGHVEKGTGRATIVGHPNIVEV